VASALAKSAISTVALVGGTVATYLALLGWDRDYDRDPATGTLSGPYEPWQIVGCAVVLALIAALAGRVCSVVVTVGATTVAFTAAWSYGAATMDTGAGDANLWPIGAVIVACGVAGWSAGFALIGASSTDRHRARRRVSGDGRR
jgi:hypothetical protein